jgi:hypothetical protein
MRLLHNKIQSQSKGYHDPISTIRLNGERKRLRSAVVSQFAEEKRASSEKLGVLWGITWPGVGGPLAAGSGDPQAMNDLQHNNLKACSCTRYRQSTQATRSDLRTAV